MEVSYETPFLAQYSSSCSPFEDDLSFQPTDHGNELVTSLSPALLILPHSVQIPAICNEHDNESLDVSSLQKNQVSRKIRLQRLPSIDQPLPRINRNNKGVRLPPSVRNTGKKIGPSAKKKFVVRNLIFPKARGVSEDDSMAMGDEWGTEKDPGFEDCQEEIVSSNKKKKKDRKTATQIPSMPIEISQIKRTFPKPLFNTTPRHTRPLHCRPIKSKKNCKRDSYLCGGDISTQETTTPAPNSSDSSSEDKANPENSNCTEITTDTPNIDQPSTITYVSSSNQSNHRPNSSTDSDHIMEIPPSPLTNIMKLKPNKTDFSENSRTSSDEEPNKITKIQSSHIAMYNGVLINSPFYSKPKLHASFNTTRSTKYRKRSSSALGIECLVAPPIPTKPGLYTSQKPPLVVADRKISISFSTSDLTNIIRPTRPAPSPPNVPQSPVPLSPVPYDSELWSQAEKGIFPPIPPKRNVDTRIMPKEEFDSLQSNNPERCNKKAQFIRTKSMENTNKINYSASYSFLGDDASQPIDSEEEREECLPISDLKKIHRKDATQFDLARAKSLEFEFIQTDTFTPSPSSQPPLTSIGYLPASMQDSDNNSKRVIDMINKVALEKNMNIEVRDVTSEESELTVPPLQMCSSANLSASNYEDSKGKKYRFVLTVHQLSPTKQHTSKKSYTTLRRVKVPLWSNQDKVIAAGLHKNLPMKQLKRQEAMYELYTSETSYKLSLSILSKFRNDSRLSPFLPEEYRILTQTDQNHLFSNSCAMLDSSKVIATEMRNRVENSLIIESITDIIIKNISLYNCFIPYCKNQYYQNLKYRELMNNNPKFVEVLTHLESDKECHNLHITSFIMLPVQRITRLPLLLSNILHYTPEKHEDYACVQTALLKLQEIAFKCDIEAHKLSSLEGLHAISTCLLYPPVVKTLPIVDPKRHLVRRGEIYRVQWRMRKLMKPEIKFERIHLILLTDIAILTAVPKKCLKSENLTYQVIDYCKRQLLTYNPIGIINKQPFPTRNRNNFYMMSRWVVSRKLIPNAFALHMLENHRGRDACYLLVPTDPTEATRWMQAISPPLIPRMPGEQLYHEFEYPQYQAISDYTAQMPDELSLDIGDVVSIHRKMPDGWFEGQRMRDEKQGWFPSSHAVEIISEATRNRNVRKAEELRRISTLIKYSDIV